MTEQPEWRRALNDSSHPMHSFAWYLFSPRFDVTKVSERFADRRAEVVPFLMTIIRDVDELYHEGSLGDGDAPINAATLLGEWQIAEAAPLLLNLLVDEYMDVLYDSAARALEQMPPETIDTILEYGQHEAHAMNAVFILSKVGKGDERSFEFICKVFEGKTDQLDIITIAECLAINNVTKAETFLQEKARHKRFRRYQEDFRKIIDEVKAGLWGVA